MTLDWFRPGTPNRRFGYSGQCLWIGEGRTEGRWNGGCRHQDNDFMTSSWSVSFTHGFKTDYIRTGHDRYKRLYFETITKRSVRIGNFLRIKRHKSRYDKCAYIVIIVVLYIFNNASGLFHVHFIYVSLTRHALKGCYLLQNVIA